VAGFAVGAGASLGVSAMTVIALKIDNNPRYLIDERIPLTFEDYAQLVGWSTRLVSVAPSNVHADLA
jgi:hypothetical protein